MLNDELLKSPLFKFGLFCVCAFYIGRMNKHS